MRELDDLLFAATGAVEADYFLLPIHGGPAIYRERVYCYELYHQLRLLWPANSRYSLGGEVDKRSHPVLMKLGADRSIPDLLVHAPGNMKGNFAIIEVKPARGLRARDIWKDIRTLSRFRVEVGYQRALYLIFGSKANDQLDRVTDEAAQDCRCPIELWTHVNPGSGATRQRTLKPQKMPLSEPAPPRRSRAPRRVDNAR